VQKQTEFVVRDQRAISADQRSTRGFNPDQSKPLIDANGLTANGPPAWPAIADGQWHMAKRGNIEHRASSIENHGSGGDAGGEGTRRLPLSPHKIRKANTL